MILRHNARQQDDPKPLPEWITDSSDNYATVKRPLPESKTDKIYAYDTDYRCNPWNEPTVYDANTLSFQMQVKIPQNQSAEAPQSPAPLSPILNKSEQTPTLRDLSEREKLDPT